jgi:uncharacterized protein (DUF1778 family)
MTEIQGESLNSFMVKAVSLAADYVEPTKKYKVAVK